MADRARTLKVPIAAVAVLVGIMNWAPIASAQVLELPTIEYKCYVIPPGPAVNEPATLEDQFDTEEVRVMQPLYLCNPATKTFGGVTFGGPIVTIPGTTIQIELPHLKCYKIVPSATVKETVTLTDQFGTEENVKITTPQFLCTTVTKTEVAALSDGSIKTRMAGVNVTPLGSPNNEAATAPFRAPAAGEPRK